VNGIIRQNRVNGVLAVSRSFGDVEHKGMAALMPADSKAPSQPQQQNVVIATPEITCEPINSSCEFIVMASDGLWDVLSSQQVSQFVFSMLAEKDALLIINGCSSINI